MLLSSILPKDPSLDSPGRGVIMAESEAHEFLGHLVQPAGVCGFLAIRGAKESQDPQNTG